VDDDLGETFAVHEEQVTSKQLQHLQSPKSAQARPFVEFHCDTTQRHGGTRQRVCKRKPNTRADQTGAKNTLKCFIRFQSGSSCRYQTRSRREPSQHQLCHLHVLLHCMQRNCHWDEETIRKRV